MAADSIASLTDSELLTMATNLHDTIQATPTNYGQAAGYVTNLNNAIEDLSTALSEHVGGAGDGEDEDGEEERYPFGVGTACPGREVVGKGGEDQRSEYYADGNSVRRGEGSEQRYGSGGVGGYVGEAAAYAALDGCGRAR
jgi:hypothetical protein